MMIPILLMVVYIEILILFFITHLLVKPMKSNIDVMRDLKELVFCIVDGLMNITKIDVLILWLMKRFDKFVKWLKSRIKKVTKY